MWVDGDCVFISVASIEQTYTNKAAAGKSLRILHKYLANVIQKFHPGRSVTKLFLARTT